MQLLWNKKQKLNILDLRKQAEEIFKHAIHALDPEQLIKNKVRAHGSTLLVDQKEYNLKDYDHIYVVGGGKACAPMAKAMEEILGNKLDNGIIIVKYDHGLPLKKIKIVEASHPLPDLSGQKGTSEILKLLSNSGKKDLIICLISGGGSALLVQPHKEISLQDIQVTSNELLSCGATIGEINSVRKHLSTV